LINVSENKQNLAQLTTTTDLQFMCFGDYHVIMTFVFSKSYQPANAHTQQTPYLQLAKDDLRVAQLTSHNAKLAFLFQVVRK